MKVLFIGALSMLLTACSVLQFNQNFGLGDDPLPNGSRNSCKQAEPSYAEELLLADGKVGIFSDQRARLVLMGPVFLPFIPLNFATSTPIGFHVMIGDATVSLDKQEWKISTDQRNWLGPTDNPPDDPFESGGGARRHLHAIFPLKMKDAEEVYLRIGGIKVGDRAIEPATIRWTRKNQTFYAPIFAPDMFGQNSGRRCK